MWRISFRYEVAREGLQPVLENERRSGIPTQRGWHDAGIAHFLETCSRLNFPKWPLLDEETGKVRRVQTAGFGTPGDAVKGGVGARHHTCKQYHNRTVLTQANGEKAVEGCLGVSGVARAKPDHRTLWVRVVSMSAMAVPPTIAASLGVC